MPAHTVQNVLNTLSLEHAALIETIAVAVHDVRRGRVVASEDVLIIAGDSHIIGDVRRQDSEQIMACLLDVISSIAVFIALNGG